MAVSTTQSVGGVMQGGYVPQTDPVISTPDPVIKAVEITPPAKSDTSSDDQKDKGREGEASREAIKKAVNDINKHANGTEAIFGIHDKTNRVTIKIVDKDSREVIKEIPAEETLDLIAKAWEMAGIMVDEKR